MCQNRGIKTKIYKETGVSTHWEKILTILPSKSHVEEWSSEDKSMGSSQVGKHVEVLGKWQAQRGHGSSSPFPYILSYASLPS